MSKFYVIGIDDNGEREFSDELVKLIAAHQVFSGGKRHHKLVERYLPQAYRWIDITVPLDVVFDEYHCWQEIVVFASGDPLFFGFATTIQKRLPDAEIIVYPYFNSLQILAHRLVMSYHDMSIVSLTGRPWHEFDRVLIEGKGKIGVLTDRTHTPAVIAARMLEYGYDNYRMTVGELLGNVGEKVREMSLKEAVETKFESPNCLILNQTAVKMRPFGVPESDFHLLNGRTKMITKMPIRLLTLSMLDLHNRKSFWDVGFCTASVSIEAKLQFPHLWVTAFEIREEGRELMERNARRFGTPGIESVIGDFTQQSLSAYPLPDAVFIGGHGGKLEQILKIISNVILPDGVVVCNAVTVETFNSLQELAAKYGFDIGQTTSITIDEYHPIQVVKLIKRKETWHV